MKWPDWLGYPGMLEDQNMEAMIKLITKQTAMQSDLVNTMNSVANTMTLLNDRIEAIENILRQKGLAQ